MKLWMSCRWIPGPSGEIEAEGGKDGDAGGGLISSSAANFWKEMDADKTHGRRLGPPHPPPPPWSSPQRAWTPLQGRWA